MSGVALGGREPHASVHKGVAAVVPAASSCVRSAAPGATFTGRLRKVHARFAPKDVGALGGVDREISLVRKEALPSAVCPSV